MPVDVHYLTTCRLYTVSLCKGILSTHCCLREETSMSSILIPCLSKHMLSSRVFIWDIKAHNHH